MLPISSVLKSAEMLPFALSTRKIHSQQYLDPVSFWLIFMLITNYYDIYTFLVLIDRPPVFGFIKIQSNRLEQSVQLFFRFAFLVRLHQQNSRYLFILGNSYPYYLFILKSLLFKVSRCQLSFRLDSS